MVKKRSLHPTWGSGSRPYIATFKACPISKNIKAELEYGDKVILPEKSLRKIKILNLPFPFLFEIRRGGRGVFLNTSKADQRAHQFCSVYEFSGKRPDEILLPAWMLRNLRVKRGGSVSIRSALDLPTGEQVTFQAASIEFADLLHSIGPQTFMESAMCKYSVLSLNQRLIVHMGGRSWQLRVKQLRPAPAVSVLGNLDLEVEFMPPTGVTGIETTTGPSHRNEVDSTITSAPVRTTSKLVSPKRKHVTKVCELSPSKKQHILPQDDEDFLTYFPREVSASLPQLVKTNRQAGFPEEVLENNTQEKSSDDAALETTFVPQDSKIERRRKAAEAALRRLESMKKKDLG